jgi:hypothetical protein
MVFPSTKPITSETTTIAIESALARMNQALPNHLRVIGLTPSLKPIIINIPPPLPILHPPTVSSLVAGARTTYSNPHDDKPSHTSSSEEKIRYLQSLAVGGARDQEIQTMSWLLFKRPPPNVRVIVRCGGAGMPESIVSDGANWWGLRLQESEGGEGNLNSFMDASEANMDVEGSVVEHEA